MMAICSLTVAAVLRPGICAALVLCCSVLQAQTTAEEGSRNRGIGEVEIPLPVVSPRAVNPLSIPLSAKEKAALAFRDTFYPQAIANRLILASISQVTRHPSDWPSGPEGFGMRFGHRMGALATGQAIELGGNVLLHTDPRYDLCRCSGVGSRVRHAWKQVVTMRRDSGSETIGLSRIASDLGTPWVAHQWLPDRLNDPGHNVSAGVSRMAVRGITNMLREFWPDIARATRMPARFRDLGSGRN